MADTLRQCVAVISFATMIAGIALLSIPLSMVVGGGLLLAGTIYGQSKQPPRARE